MRSSGAEVVKVCLHYNAFKFVARGILITLWHCGTPELHFSAICIVSSVGTSHQRAGVYFNSIIEIRQ